MLAHAPLARGALQSMAPAAQLQIPNRDTTLKFHADGSPRAFAGNTVICHMPAQCAMREAMAGLREALAGEPFRSKLGFTAATSYHMTIFPGANDQDRKISGWPDYVPAEAPIQNCNHSVGERMARARLQCELPIRVRLDGPATQHYPTACTMRMVPLDAAEERKIRSLRDTLSALYGFRLPDHDTYQLHITMAYQLQPLTADEQTTYRALLARHIRQISDAQPVLELGNPEYCTFSDMDHFNPVKLLTCG